MRSSTLRGYGTTALGSYYCVRTARGPLDQCPALQDEYFMCTSS